MGHGAWGRGYWLLVQELRRPKKPGFFTKRRVRARRFAKKPGFWAPVRPGLWLLERTTNKKQITNNQ